MKIKSVKNVDNGTEVVVFLDKNETLDVNMCRKAGKQAEYDAYVIIDTWSGGIVKKCSNNNNTEKEVMEPEDLLNFIDKGLISNDGDFIITMNKLYYNSFQEANESLNKIKNRLVIIKGFNTKTGQLFDLEED